MPSRRDKFPWVPVLAAAGGVGVGVILGRTMFAPTTRPGGQAKGFFGSKPAWQPAQTKELGMYGGWGKHLPTGPTEAYRPKEEVLPMPVRAVPGPGTLEWLSLHGHDCRSWGRLTWEQRLDLVTRWLNEDAHIRQISLGATYTTGVLVDPRFRNEIAHRLDVACFAAAHDAPHGAARWSLGQFQSTAI